MDFEEKTIHETSLYQGKIIDVKKLSVRLPNGKVTDREIVCHPGAVAVLAEPEPGKLILVEQFRKPVEGTLLEVPAGKLEPGEDPRDAAIRELREETGYNAQSVELVFSFYTSPGFANEKIDLYYARGLQKGQASPDEDEFVRTILYQKSELEDLLKNGQITDAKTLIGVLWWSARSDNR
jgi:ADP-ribose pyrophosphatase